MATGRVAYRAHCSASSASLLDVCRLRLLDLLHRLCGSLVDVEGELDVVVVDANAIVRLQPSTQQQPRDLVLELALNRTTQRPRAELRVEADFGQVLDGRVGELDFDVLCPEAPRGAV